MTTKKWSLISLSVTRINIREMRITERATPMEHNAEVSASAVAQSVLLVWFILLEASLSICQHGNFISILEMNLHTSVSSSHILEHKRSNRITPKIIKAFKISWWGNKNVLFKHCHGSYLRQLYLINNIWHTHTHTLPSTTFPLKAKYVCCRCFPQ